MKLLGATRRLLQFGAVAAGLLTTPALAEDTVRVGLAAFQDVNSIYVGIEKGIFEKEGIKFDIQNTDWPSANELLIGGHVDIASSGDADIVLQNGRGIDTTLAFPVFYFAGGGLMYSPEAHKDWKTYADLSGSAADTKAAIKATLEQAKGAKVGVSSGGSEYASFIEMLTVSGLNPKDYQIVDLSQEELPPALLSGSIDIMISGIPQRLAVLRQGYSTLIDQSAVPSTIAHAGFAAKRSWVDANPDLAVRLSRGFIATLKFIEDNPDQSFPIIAEHLREAGTQISPEEIKAVWNVMEFFPSSKEWFDQKVIQTNGSYYWKDRFGRVVENLKTEGRVMDFKTPLEDLVYGLKLIPKT